MRKPTLTLLLGFLLLSCLLPAAAGAVSDSEEFRRFGGEGSGAGELNLAPGSIATDPATGTVYVAEQLNHRVSLFSAWGDFIKAIGWGVADGSPELQECTSSCQAGTRGDGPGQFNSPQGGVAMAPDGSFYVSDTLNLRVQKFSADGEFVLMFGSGVNETTGGDVCTAASGDQCRAGASGAGPGELSELARGLDVGPDGTVFVADEEQIQSFEPDGTFKAAIATPGRTAIGLAVDPTGAFLYVIFDKEEDVHKLDLAGAEVGSLPVNRPRNLAVDPEGTVYVVDGHTSTSYEQVRQFDAAGEEMPSCCIPAFQPGLPETTAGTISLGGLGTNTEGDLYVATSQSTVDTYITAYGPPPIKWPPPLAAPEVSHQFSSGVTDSSASVGAMVNPRFWEDTSYFVEYGLADCALSACTKEPAPPGLGLGAGAVSKAVATEAITLSGLAPDTTYHYRFVAQSSGGGPTFGPDRTFTTFPAPSPPETACSNQAFRTGASALLPDCRAFEMVSPVDKENGEIVALISVTGFENRLNQASLDGSKLTYSSYRAFAGSPSSSYTSQYLAERGPTGWSSEALGEPRGAGLFETNFATENEYKVFSADLCEAWLLREADPQLAPGAVPGFPNLYRRDNCPKAYEALSTVAPPNLEPRDYVPELQGRSADGAKAIFRVNDKLTDDATAGVYQLYEAAGGSLKLVCILPGEVPYAGHCSAGTPSPLGEATYNRLSSVDNAMSEDGSRIYWSASSSPSVPGKIYLRLNGTATVEVSGKASTAEARFWGASPDGAKALFTIEDQTVPITALNRNLYRYDLATESATKLAGQVVGVAAAGEDLSRVYFVSEEAIGGEGTAGQPNLYLSEGGTTSFIATLSREDVRAGAGGPLPSVTTPEAVYHAAQATPDGERLTFISNRSLTGADNTDAVSGKTDSEVFTYGADTGALECASCSPAGAVPRGRLVQAQGNAASLWTAAFIPTNATSHHTPRALSEDGDRLFFTSYADLLPADVNGKADVYEWELPGASASCEDEADPDFYPVNGACLFLISSGKGTSDSEFIEATPDGSSAFLATRESLLPQDPDLIDVYAARTGGGFPPPPAPPVPCQGEACQPQQQAPVLQSPQSDAPRAGNPPRRPRCPKGKHRARKGKAKGRCVGRHKRHHKKSDKRRNGGRAAAR